MPAASPLKTMDDLVAALKADPGAVSWGGGSAGGTDHITAGLIAKAAGVDPTKVNYIAFSGGGEALAAILGGQVTVGHLRLRRVREPGRGGRAARARRLGARNGSPGVEAPDAEGGRRRRGGGELAHGGGRRRGSPPSSRRRSPPTSRRWRSRSRGRRRWPTKGWIDTLPRRRRVPRPARRRHRGDRRDPERHRPRAMSRRR